MPRILGIGAAFSVVLTAFEFTGGNLRGKRTEVEGMDEYERKEYLRKNRRRPIEETIADIGEGRGTSSLQWPVQSQALSRLLTVHRNRAPRIRRAQARAT
jgi:hypothetical protein